MRLRKVRASWLGALILVFTAMGVTQLAGAATIKAKAWLAPILIERAWKRSVAAGELGVPPWSWADTYPVARLSVPSSNKNFLVLAGDSGNALAFGPGHTLASAPLGEKGVSVIGGHRDTHFAFLQTVDAGAEVLLETVDGARQSYRIQSRRIVDADADSLAISNDRSALWLVTCYPFDALFPGGSLRYVVEAVPVQSRTSGAM